MKKKLFILGISLIASVGVANEMFATPPTEYLISGADIYGESAYQIHAFADHRAWQEDHVWQGLNMAAALPHSRSLLIFKQVNSFIGRATVAF